MHHKQDELPQKMYGTKISKKYLIASEKSKITLIIGDFNARLECRTEQDETIMGKRVIGRGEYYLEKTAEDTKENRNNFT